MPSFEQDDRTIYSLQCPKCGFVGWEYLNFKEEKGQNCEICGNHSQTQCPSCFVWFDEHDGKGPRIYGSFELPDPSSVKEEVR